MNPNYFGVISAVLSLVTFFAVYHVAKDKTVKTRLILSISTSIAALPGASFAAYYAHILPESVWYYEFRSCRGTEFLVIFIGVAGGLWTTIVPSSFRRLPLLGVMAFSIVPIIKPFIGPISASTYEDKWDGEVCLQSTPSTCGAASTATVLKYHGISVTESDLAREAHSYSGGTEAWYLARAVRSRGLDVQFDFTSEFTPGRGLPAVVGVKLGRIGHFIAVISHENDQFLIGEPLSGGELLSREELLRRYSFTGFHMRITGIDDNDL